MIAHVWSVLCARSIVDRDSNNISLLDVIEQLNLAIVELPAIIPAQFELVTLWTRADNDMPAIGRGRVRYLCPTNELLAQIEHAIDHSDYRRTRQRSGLVGLPISGFGRHSLHVELQVAEDGEWTEVANLPLEVIAQEQPN